MGSHTKPTGYFFATHRQICCKEKSPQARFVLLNETEQLQFPGFDSSQSFFECFSTAIALHFSFVCYDFRIWLLRKTWQILSLDTKINRNRIEKKHASKKQNKAALEKRVANKHQKHKTTQHKTYKKTNTKNRTNKHNKTKQIRNITCQNNCKLKHKETKKQKNTTTTTGRFKYIAWGEVVSFWVPAVF